MWVVSTGPVELPVPMGEVAVVSAGVDAGVVAEVVRRAVVPVVAPGAASSPPPPESTIATTTPATAAAATTAAGTALFTRPEATLAPPWRHGWKSS